MKRFLATLLAVLYFASTTGATVHLHYCMDKLVEQEMLHSNPNACSSCGMEKKQQNQGCCKDEVKQLKVDNNHFASVLDLQALQLSGSDLPVSFLEIPLFDFSSVTEENPVSNAPPRSSGTPLFKRNCVFRI